MKTGKRDYHAIAKSPIARFVCDLWRLAIEQFSAGKEKNIYDMIATMPGTELPHMTQMTLSSSHLMKIYDKLPNKRAKSEQVRVAAIKEILDRAYRKSPQPMDGDGTGGPMKIEVTWLK